MDIEDKYDTRHNYRVCPRCNKRIRQITPDIVKVGLKHFHADCLEPFVIARTCTKFCEEVDNTYQLIYDPSSAPIDLSRGEARSIIRRYGLVMVVDDDGDALFDSPDRRFQEKYKGFHARKKEEIRIKWKDWYNRRNEE